MARRSTLDVEAKRRGRRWSFLHPGSAAGVSLDSIDVRQVLDAGPVTDGTIGALAQDSEDARTGRSGFEWIRSAIEGFTKNGTLRPRDSLGSLCSGQRHWS